MILFFLSTALSHQFRVSHLEFSSMRILNITGIAVNCDRNRSKHFFEKFISMLPTKMLEGVRLIDM